MSDDSTHCSACGRAWLKPNGRWCKHQPGSKLCQAIGEEAKQDDCERVHVWGVAAADLALTGDVVHASIWANGVVKHGVPFAPLWLHIVWHACGGTLPPAGALRHLREDREMQQAIITTWRISGRRLSTKLLASLPYFKDVDQLGREVDEWWVDELNMVPR